MNGIPPDIYQRVHELAVDIVNATEAGDETLCEAKKLALRGYFEERAYLGLPHPFLTEALADYTDSAAEAVRLYELALRQARECPGEPTHTKMISLATRLVELGRIEQAEAYLRDGRAAADRAGDTDSVREVDDLIR